MSTAAVSLTWETILSKLAEVSPGEWQDPESPPPSRKLIDAAIKVAEHMRGDGVTVPQVVHYWDDIFYFEWRDAEAKPECIWELTFDEVNGPTLTRTV